MRHIEREFNVRRHRNLRMNCLHAIFGCFYKETCQDEYIRSGALHRCSLLPAHLKANGAIRTTRQSQDVVKGMRMRMLSELLLLLLRRLQRLLAQQGSRHTTAHHRGPALLRIGRRLRLLCLGLHPYATQSSTSVGRQPLVIRRLLLRRLLWIVGVVVVHSRLVVRPLEVAVVVIVHGRPLGHLRRRAGAMHSRRWMATIVVVDIVVAAGTSSRWSGSRGRGSCCCAATGSWRAGSGSKTQKIAQSVKNLIRSIGGTSTWKKWEKLESFIQVY